MPVTDISRQRHPAPAGRARRRPAAVGAPVRPAVRAGGRDAAGRRADRRRGHRHRRGDRAVQGRHARRRRRDRPASCCRLGARQHPDQPYQDPRVHHPRQRRPRLPGAHRQEVRPDPVRAARLADPGGRRQLAAAGELPVHRAGHAGRPRPPQARRRLLDVQLLPRELAGRPARRDRAERVRPRAVRRRGQRRPASRPCITAGATAADQRCAGDVGGRGRRHPAAGRDDRPVPLPEGPRASRRSTSSRSA